ncbi:MAG: AMP-binding protein, partial [Verrucomicrobiaceae bacterium]
MRGTEVPSLDRGGPESLSYPGYGNEWLDRPVIQRFEHCARQKPDAIAIRDRQGCLSYRELLSECWRIASYIDRETPPGSPIAIALPVDRHYPVAMLSALAAGRPYVPLDLSHPPERLRHILTHSGAEYVLTDTAQSTMVAQWLPSTTKLLLRDIQHRTKISTGWLPPASAGDVAYIIYTSGSSGIPKGVYQNQRGLSHDVMQYTRSIHLRPDDILTGIYSPSVNGAIRDVFGALLNGATLLLFNLRSEGLGYVAEALKLHSATILHAMPPVMRSLLRALEGPTSLASVRMIYLAGDKLFSSDLLEIRKYLRPDASVYVGIGSTECATLYRQWFVPKDFTPSGPLVPSGRPVPDRIVEILEPGGKPVAPGETGQIVVSSPFIALGYWRDEIRTNAQFSGDPARAGWSRFATG